jgi:hypothetical protein
VQAFGYETRLSGHIGSGPPWNGVPFSRASSQAVGPPNFRIGGPKLRAWLPNSDVVMSGQMGTVGSLLRHRRSHKKKHLRKIDTKPKLSIRRLRSTFPKAPT